jgi:NADH-quinone oxidoreductase subunit N
MIDYANIISAHRAEILLADAAVLILLVDRLLLGARSLALRHTVGSALTALSCAAAIAWQHPGFAGMAILVLAAANALLSRETRFTSQVGEYYVILLLATTGLLVMTTAETWLLAFVGLETASLSLYALVAFDKSRPTSAEAGLKYFLIGGVSAAFLLYGLSLIYGVTGKLGIGETGEFLIHGSHSPLLFAGMLMAVVGFSFKIAAAPFHLWAPDAYQGAPTPVASFVASASKIGGVALFLRLFGTGLTGPRMDFANGLLENQPAWVPALLWVSLASMVIGNVTALAQHSVKRLLAYSSVAHAGYLLIGFAAGGAVGGMPSVEIFYYITTYAIATCGAFGVVAIVERANDSDDMDSFRGLYQRNPLLAGLLAVFLLSLAGIPPLAGFFGKFQLFAKALGAGGGIWIGMIAFAIAMSAVSLYYYLQVLKRAFVSAPDENAQAVRAISPVSLAVLVALAAVIVAGGVWPDLLNDLIRNLDPSRLPG